MDTEILDLIISSPTALGDCVPKCRVYFYISDILSVLRTCFAHSGVVNYKVINIRR